MGKMLSRRRSNVLLSHSSSVSRESSMASSLDALREIGNGAPTLNENEENGEANGNGKKALMTGTPKVVGVRSDGKLEMSKAKTHMGAPSKSGATSGENTQI